MLYKMVEVGNVIQMRDGSIHTVTHVVGAIAYYSLKYRSFEGELLNDCFIAKFRTNGRSVTTYNKNVTLIDAGE